MAQTRQQRRRAARERTVPDLGDRTLEQRLFDRSVLQATRTARLARGEAMRLSAIWEAAADDVDAAVTGRLGRLQMRGQLSPVLQTAAYTEVTRRVTEILNEAGKRFAAALEESVWVVARAEARWAEKAIEEVVQLVQPAFRQPATTAQSIRNAIKAPIQTNPAKLQAETLKGLTKGLTERQVTQATRQITQGLTRGRSHEDIAKGLQELLQKDTVREAETLVRTAVNHVSNMSAEAVFHESSVVIGVVWIATLDRRTTDTCKSLDGETFRTGDGPRPPMHYLCRSRTSPLLRDAMDILNGDLDKPVTQEMLDRAASRRRGTRAAFQEQAAVNAPVKATMTYGEWLKTQPAATQDAALGSKTKGRWFRQGKLDVKDFVDKDYAPLTIADLRAKYPGLD